MEAARVANLAARFLLELCALAAFAYWGFERDGSARYLLGVGSPLVAAVVWGVFVSPKARVRVPGGVRLAIEVAFFGLAALALAAAGHPALAGALALAGAANIALLYALGDHPSVEARSR